MKERTEDIAVDCFRYFGFQSLDQVLLLDLREYRLLCKAHRLRMVDKRFWISQQAFENNRARLRKKNGKLLFPSLKKLFDYEDALNKASDNPAKAEKQMSPTAMRLKQFMTRRKGGEDGSES